MAFVPEFPAVATVVAAVIPVVSSLVPLGVVRFDDADAGSVVELVRENVG